MQIQHAITTRNSYSHISPFVASSILKLLPWMFIRPKSCQLPEIMHVEET
jgi:hypothetical protein